MGSKKYLDLKGNVSGTPYGIKVTIFINDKILDKCQVFRDNYNVKKTKLKDTVPSKVTAEEIDDKRRNDGVKHEDAFKKVFAN